MLQLERAPATRSRSSFVSSLAIHAVAVAVLWNLPGGPDRTPIERTRSEAKEATPVRLVSPPPVWRNPDAPRIPRAPKLAAAPTPRPRFTAPAVRRTATPEPNEARLEARSVEVAAEIAIESRAPEIAWKSESVEVAAPEVREAGFGAAPVPVTKPAPSRVRVQAGGFGAAEQRDGRRGAQAEVSLAGFSQGARGGAQKPSRGVVATSAGFGAAQTSGGRGDAGAPSVQSGGFGAVERGARPATKTVARQAKPETPLRIDSKPKPRYSDEARTRGVEGDVRLRVRFLASGAAEVIEIVSGLGFGLDEAAADAARGIRFRPAERDGRPVDTVAIIRITFQTAS